MTYTNMTPGTFLSRPNRFIAHVEIGEKTEVVHVKNTGRCRELLPVGAQVWCQKSDNPSRKTKYDLITVKKENGSSIWTPRHPTSPLVNGFGPVVWDPQKIFAQK